MLEPDSLVTDLIFRGNANLEQGPLIEGLGGEDWLATKKLLDVDMLDPRAEMELSPSMPFRRRGERRLLLIDDQTGPIRDHEIDPSQPPTAADAKITLDLRPYKEKLIDICTALPIRLGRLFVLSGWGDAVLVAREAKDLRGICLIPWALDPQIDMDGKRRSTRLSQKEFEAKILAFEKRLDKLDDEEILASLAGVSFERRGELLIVDALEADGTWDMTKSLMMANNLAAMDRFSMLPGAPSGKRIVAPAAAARPAAAAPAPVAAPEPKPEPKGPPLSATEVDGEILLVFPEGRFDLDVAAALGKKDWDSIVRSSDKLTGMMRDRIHRDGARWVAPLEFLSEVFVDGKPLTKPAFEQTAEARGAGVRALDVHFPRFGPVTLLEVTGKGRFVTSLTDRAERVMPLIGGTGPS